MFSAKNSPKKSQKLQYSSDHECVSYYFKWTAANQKRHLVGLNFMQLAEDGFLWTFLQ